MIRLPLMAIAMSLPLVVTASPATADFHSGNSLYEYCKVERSDADYSAKKAHCLGYIIGAADGLENGNVFGQVLAGRADEVGFICVPESVTAGQISDVVIEYLERNPSERHEGASVLVVKALLRAWGCVG